MSEAVAVLANADDVWERVRPDLEFVRVGYPFEAIELAETSREAVTPHLLQLLEDLAADPAPTLHERYVLHLHAICLLAAWRETRAYAPLIKLSTQPEERGDELFGDFTGEILGRALASVCDGDLAPLHALASRVDVDPWLRDAALEALATRAFEGDADVGAVVEFCERLGNEEAARLRASAPEERDATFLSCVACTLADIGPAPALASIRGWYADGLVEEGHVSLGEIESEARKTWDERLRDYQMHGNGYVASASKEMAGWYCFRDPDEENDEDADEDEDYYSYGEPYVRTEPKIGRNDPCPCGSGKKYKKCCLSAVE
jgi:hypothetical protein